MKKLHISGNLLKVLLLGALLTGCQNDDVVSPQQTTDINVNDPNAKVNAELKLIKDGTAILQYVKQGRFTGQLSKVSETGSYVQYSYDDSTGDLWITSKRYNKSTNALIEEIKYKTVRGLCVTSINVTTGWTSQFSYNQGTRLGEITLTNGSMSQKHIFTYNYNPATATERLSKIVKSTPVGDYEQIDFLYIGTMATEKKEVYQLNSKFIGLDPYLPYFGKFSDVLIQQVFIKPLPYTNQTKPYYKLFYSFDAAGYVIGRNIEFRPLGWGNDAGMQNLYNVYQYSTGWQGI
ncbi:hypothetical protein [Dyadobacter fermentans]|uniref:hypothetical protein n=1 Tax=Dyadobacter fermentans TaxID=94254 RepID=UPI001CBAA8CA|nr:hypothetical protein [Dyadobacter fermentans]MBZ1358796.1 hypothetical protein [Dyadobacter fermentans]